jgi:hypothetical protein
MLGIVYVQYRRGKVRLFWRKVRRAKVAIKGQWPKYIAKLQFEVYWP